MNVVGIDVLEERLEAWNTAIDKAIIQRDKAKYEIDLYQGFVNDIQKSIAELKYGESNAL